MSKFKIAPFLIIIIFFLNNCGFTPQYSGFKGVDFSIEIEKAEGDRELNNAIKSQLDIYSNKKNKNLEIKYIKIKSKFIKDTLSKDTKGKATKYKLIADVEFTINTEDGSRVIKLIEDFKIDKIEDNVEENNYIRIIKRDFAGTLSRKLIMNINQNK